MGLKVWGTDPENQPKPRESFSDDTVGRFRSGFQVDDQPQALDAWRVTSGDPDVMEKIAELFGGDVDEWDASGEDNLQIFTDAKAVKVILADAKALSQRMILWGRNGKPISVSDGEFLEDGSPDPDADLTFAERKQKARDGVGAVPSVEIHFRLQQAPELGLFKFVSGSWSLVSDLAYNGTEDTLKAVTEDGMAALCELKLDEVSYIARRGPMRGKTVSYTKPVLKVIRAVEPFEADDEPAF